MNKFSNGFDGFFVDNAFDSTQIEKGKSLFLITHSGAQLSKRQKDFSIILPGH